MQVSEICFKSFVVLYLEIQLFILLLRFVGYFFRFFLLYIVWYSICFFLLYILFQIFFKDIVEISRIVFAVFFSLSGGVLLFAIINYIFGFFFWDWCDQKQRGRNVIVFFKLRFYMDYIRFVCDFYFLFLNQGQIKIVLQREYRDAFVCVINI